MPCANTVFTAAALADRCQFPAGLYGQADIVQGLAAGEKGVWFSISRMGFVMVSRSSKTENSLESNRQYPPHGQEIFTKQ